VSHIAVDGAQLNSYSTKAEVSVEFEGDMVKVDLGIFSGWEKVFLGHYHCAQSLNNKVEYIGSPLELNFGEAHQQKRIVVLDTDTLETESVYNTFSPKHLIIREHQLDKHQLDGNFVQVLVDDITSTNIIDMRKTVLKDRKLGSLEFKEKKKKEDKDTPTMQEKFDFAGGAVLERWAKASGHEGLEYEKLLSIGQDIIRRS